MRYNVAQRFSERLAPSSSGNVDDATSSSTFCPAIVALAITADSSVEPRSG